MVSLVFPSYNNTHAPVAQLDRALPSEGRGQRFKSSRVRQSQLNESFLRDALNLAFKEALITLNPTSNSGIACCYPYFLFPYPLYKSRSLSATTRAWVQKALDCALDLSYQSNYRFFYKGAKLVRKIFAQASQENFSAWSRAAFGLATNPCFTAWARSSFIIPDLHPANTSSGPVTG